MFSAGKTRALSGVDYNDSNDDFAQAFRLRTFAPDRTLIYLDNPLTTRRSSRYGAATGFSALYLTDTLSPGRFGARHRIRPLQPQHRSARRLHRDTDVGDAGAGFDTAGPLVGHTPSVNQSGDRLTVTPTEL